MVVCIKTEEVDSDATPPAQTRNTSLADILVPKGSPSSLNTDRNVVFVTDALEEFPWRRFQWILDHVIPPDCTVTLLGVMPWIPLALSCKTRFWTYDFGNLSALRGRNDWKNEQKYQKIRGIIELCEQKGVVPHMQLAMGYPLKLVVLEKTTNLHANLVVLDRHQRKNKAFFAERLPSSVVMMNNNGGVDMIKIQSAISNQLDISPGESPATLPPTKVMVSEQLSELLNHNGSSSYIIRNEECQNHDSPT
ncbi:hypothetical protein KPL70_008924 [Citrus sinensis]|uniref:uncharacterized protein LOC112498380 n=1 Tax=Citrus sinensis TaxID=2711 RepID=UPI000D62E996|nr:uncharacterized protein LOC112498380 [Citrus sinensis]KAH9728187.1 hypothetical protein KPL70_008924 [Citrus sinensis]